MQPILLLDELTINQIAAGEVIEDSASCIKELIENALDAAATTITIETKGGGLELISVSDNGIGMDEKALEMSIVRHATSKLRSAEELWKLSTLGFRGEALASIAAVSLMKITSCPQGEEIAHQIEVEKGQIQKRKRSPRGQGTTFTVNSLFYNTPARASFQKSIAGQNQKIRNLLVHFALLKVHVAFEWISEGKKALTIASHTPLSERIALLLGDSFVSDLVPIDFSHGDYRIEGFLGKFSAHRSHRLHQYLFMNGRSIHSKEFSLAMNAAYGTRIPEKRFPPFVCHFHLPLQELDVNVHPQKKEVRIKDLSKVERFLCKAIHALFVPESPKLPSLPSFPTFLSPSLEKRSIETKEKQLPLPPLPLKLPILKLWEDYALVEGEELFLIDLSRATHFLFYREMRARFQDNLSLPTQKLLFPLTYHCSVQEAEIIEGQLDLLKSFGFHLRLFGRGSFIIESLPPHYHEESTRALLESFCNEKKRWSRERFAELACLKVSRRKYTLEQAEGVLKALFAIEAPYYLTNGKAVTFVLTKENIQKMIS